MAENKKSFVLYSDVIHTVSHLTDEQAGILFKHILDYVNDKDPITDNVLINLAFEPIKQVLKRDLKKWEKYIEKQRENGAKGGRPHKETETQITQAFSENPPQPKKADSVNVIVNVSDNVNSVHNSENWDMAKKRWKQDFRYKEKVCRDKDLAIGVVETRMDEFISEIELKEDFKDIPALKKHFINWNNKRYNGKHNTSTVGKKIEFDRP